MRRRAQTLEDASRSQEQGAGAHRSGPARRLMCLPNPGEQLVVALVARPASSWDYDDVGLRNLAQAAIGAQRQRAGIGALASGLSGHEQHLGSWQAAEHLVGPDRVERGQPLEQRDGDLHQRPAYGTPTLTRGGASSPGSAKAS